MPELDKLLRFIARHQISVVSSPIPASGHIPPEFLNTLVTLEESVNKTIAAEKSAGKKMAPNKAKALNGMKQTLKKKAKEFEQLLATYKEVRKSSQFLFFSDPQDPSAYATAYNKANAPAAAPKVKKTPAQTQEQEDASADFTTIGKGGKALNLTADGVFRTLREIFEQRGRKNTDRAETIKILQKLLEVSATTYQKIRVYLALVPARLDYSQNLTSMPQDSWVACRQELEELITLLLKEKDYVVQDQVEEYDDSVDREPQEVDGKLQRVKVAGSIVGLVENLDNEVSSVKY